MSIVEMHRVPRPKVGFDNFDCPGSTWETLLELGKVFGWQPKGMMGGAKDRNQRSMRYIPGMYDRYMTEVDCEDAENWAQALDRAVNYLEKQKIELPHAGPYIISENMSPEMHDIANGPINIVFVKSFTTYLHQGGFTCAYDD